MRIPALTFAGLPGADQPGPHQIAVLGIEHATPYERGKPSHSAGAPAALRAALTNYNRLADHYDFDIGGLRPDSAVDCGDLPGDPADPTGNREAITRAVRALLDVDAIPVVLGGDDSVPIPMFGAFEGRGPLTVVQIDAHLDWRDEVRGEKYGYSSPMRRASEMPWIRRMVQVGLRGVGSARAAEVADARSWGSRLVPAVDVHRHGIGRVLDLVDEDASCLVTLDCDGMDPTTLPAVLSPVPGGLLYWQVLDLLHGLAAKCRIVGFDLVEFMPSRDTTGVAALTAARLVCNAIAAIATSLPKRR
ncbi:MAG TPA: arginase family protein [Methylomirabilota bacterium]|nr:arginase family protein [Methylomirabilota bacterium]